MNLFIITSCINTDIGAFNSDERYNQTKATIESIRNRGPENHIAILETSDRQFDKEDANIVVNYSESVFLKNIYDNFGQNDVILKSLSEIYIMSNFLKNFEYISNYERIFKISGRYWLSEQFNLQDYDYSVKNKYVFKTRFPTAYDPVITNNILYQLKTRLWSFDFSLIFETIYLLDIMFSDLLELIQQQKYADIEHLFFKHIYKKDLTEFDIIGLAGLQAPDSKLVIE